MRALILMSLATACAVTPSTTEPSTTDDPDRVSACGEDLDVFTEHVWEPVLQARCMTCHRADSGSDAADSAFRLDPGDLAASMRSAIQVADRIALKPTGAHPDGHGGGAFIERNSPEFAALAFWQGWVVDGVCEPPGDWTCEDAPSPRLLRRLTHHEYDRTVRELLGVEAHFADRFPADDVVDGFHNDARALVVSDLLATNYAEAAEQLSSEADLRALLPCDPGAIGRSACGMAFVEDFGFRAFRRPLTQDDVDRYHALFVEVATEDGFEAGLRWVVIAMLQSPHFLYRSELGVRGEQGFVMTDWELASALSYALWSAPPDDELLGLAATGALSDPAVRAEQVERLAADPRAAETTADFVEAWLHLDRLETVSREGIGPELRSDLRQETRDLVIDIAVNGGSLDDLMQATHTFADPALAAHYGLADSGRVDLSGTAYGGLLTQGSVLTTHGRHLGSSPVQRGVLVRERLLCEPLPPPPANVDASPPELDPTASTREHYIQHAEDPSCAECHDQIDPIGFGFEHFDELGRFRAMDGVHPVDDSGNVDAVPFEGPQELADVLVDDPRFRSCFVKMWRRFSTGVDACANDPVQVGLMQPLTRLPDRLGFTLRHGGSGEGDSFAVGARVELELPDDEPPDEGLSVTTSVNDWGGGYCNDVTVLNEGSTDITWTVTLPIDGEITSQWNSRLIETGADWVFSGDGSNAVVAPGATVGFGFCASR